MVLFARTNVTWRVAGTGMGTGKYISSGVGTGTGTGKVFEVVPVRVRIHSKNEIVILTKKIVNFTIRWLKSARMNSK